MNYFYENSDGLFIVGSSIAPPTRYSLQSYVNNTIISLKEVETGNILLGPIEVTNIQKEDDSYYTDLEELLTEVKKFFGNNNSDYCAEYQAVYNSWTTKPIESVANEQNTMVEFLVNSGVWAKLDVFYVFASHTNNNNESLTNWKNPGTFDSSIVLNGGTLNYITFEGVQSSNNAYINTNFNPTIAGLNYSKDSAAMGVYSRTNIRESAIDCGSTVASSDSTIATRWSDLFIIGLNSLAASAVYIANTDSTGMYATSRPDSANIQGWKNKVSLINTALNSSNLSNENMFVLGSSTGGSLNRPSTKQISLFFAGGTLNQTDVNNTTDAFEAYMDSNGKGVIT